MAEIRNGVLIKVEPGDINENGTYIIPADVKSIGQSAFNGCTGLKEVTIPGSVESIDLEAFAGCTGLKEVTMPKNVKSIGGFAFAGCAGLKSITIPGSVKSIGNRAFSGCTGLTQVTIPEGVESIGFEVFKGCTGLTQVTIPEGVESIGFGVFKGCTGLAQVTMPGSVKSIGEWAFNGCTGLKEVTIPGSVKSIGREAFEGCAGLTSVTIPEGVKSIGGSAFRGCTGLKEVNVSDANKTYARGCTLLHLAAETQNTTMMRVLLGKDGINLLLEDGNYHTPLLGYISWMRQSRSLTDADKESAIRFFLDYKQKIIERHGQGACNAEMQNIATKLRLSLQDVTQGRIFEGLSEDLMQRLLNDAQSTHRGIVHQTAAATALSLRQQYKPDLSGLESAVREKLGDKVTPFLTLLNTHKDSRENLSGLGLKEAFALVWTGLNDDSYLSESEKERGLEDNLKALNDSINDLMNTYGENSPACFGGLFNGLMQLAYTGGIPGAIVLMDEVEKSQAAELLKGRHGLLGQYQRLSEDEKKQLIDNEANFEAWKQKVIGEQSALLERYKTTIALTGGIQPFQFLEGHLAEIKAGFSLTHAAFKEGLDVATEVKLLPVFSGMNAEDYAQLSVKFNETMNFDSLFSTKKSFFAALREAGTIQAGCDTELADEQQLISWVTGFFDSQVERMLRETKGDPALTLGDFYSSNGDWTDLKEVQVENLLGRAWVTNQESPVKTTTDIGATTHKATPPDISGTGDATPLVIAATQQREDTVDASRQLAANHPKPYELPDESTSPSVKHRSKSFQHYLRRTGVVVLSALMGVLKLGLPLWLPKLGKKDAKREGADAQTINTDKKSWFTSDAVYKSSTTGLGFFHRLEMEKKLTGINPTEEDLLDAGIDSGKIHAAQIYFGIKPKPNK